MNGKFTDSHLKVSTPLDLTVRGAFVSELYIQENLLKQIILHYIQISRINFKK